MRINSARISHQLIDGEIVAINLENGCYYSLLDLSAAIWQLLDARWSREAIVGAVKEAYPETPDAGELAGRFIDDLVAENLVVADDEGNATATAAPLPPVFTSPLLEKFTDMQELLMLDPIHEVDEQGWPHKPSES